MCTFTALGFLAVNPILYSCILMHKIKAYQIVNTRESKTITTMEACENGETNFYSLLPVRLLDNIM